jgi:hypothetical protein
MKCMFKSSLLAGSIGLLLFFSAFSGFAQSQGPKAAPKADALKSAGTKSEAAKADIPNSTTHGIAVANIDPSVIPGDDFYDYANGAWIKRTEIPADRPGMGVFTYLADQTSKRTAALIEEFAKSNAPSGSSARQIADLFNSYMN